MNSKENQYRILGKSFSQSGLKSFCLEKISVLGTPQWERDIWTFILNWLSPGETVEVITSGSTAAPKSMLLQKKYMVESAGATISFFNLERNDAVLLCLPVKFIAGKMMVVRALLGELDLQFIEPSSCPDLSRFDNLKFAAMTPMQVANVLKMKLGTQLLGKIDKLIVGGSALPSGLDKMLQKVNTKVWQTYGMTETITHIALRKVNGMDASEWYHPLPGVSLRVDDKNCLIIDHSKIGISHLITNDVAELNRKDQFRVFGRIDNVVNSGGIKLHPELIERKLEGLLDFEFYVGGIRDEILGERLVLFVEAKEGENEDPSTLMARIKNKLSGFEIPKETIYQPKFKRTLNGKIIRSKSV